MQRRLLIFALLGPLIGLLVIAPPAVLVGGLPKASEVPSMQFWTYLFGVIPALLTGLIDNALVRVFPRRERAMIVGMAGAVVSGAAAGIVMQMGFVGVLVGAAGIIPAAVCSLVSGDK